MKKLAILLVMIVLLVGTVMAQQLSIQLKRTNPGIAGKKSATLIFDVANIDMTHKMQGLILCKSPDDVLVSSSFGAAMGSGAQYLSEIFTIGAPYQKAMTITVESTEVGDKHAGCLFKYIPYKEVTEEGITTEEPFDVTKTVGVTGATQEGYQLTFVLYTEAIEDDPETTDVDESAPAKVVLNIDGEENEFEFNTEVEVNGLKVTVISATDDSAEVRLIGKTKVTTGSKTVKMFKLMNGQYKNEDVITDDDWRIISLDKNVPFVADMSDPQCPEGKNQCAASEVVDIGGMKIPTWAIIVGALLVILLIAYLLGKTSRS